MLRKVPLIVILGSTGTGKTKLSLELAERFGGEIISADSMQVYANLNIVTAKATKEEQSRAKHHLLDVVPFAVGGSVQEPFTVVDFRNAALPIIEQLLAQSKCPIVVGGTNYYIESLLWDILVSQSQRTAASANTVSAMKVAAKSENFNNAGAELPTTAEMSAMSSELLHHHLRCVDPVTADRIHPNNKRKIKRAIEVYQQTGCTLSAQLDAQRSQPGGNRLGGPLRYPHTVILWLRCKQVVLNDRLDRRVDGMLEQGLLRELRAFHDDRQLLENQQREKQEYQEKLTQSPSTSSTDSIADTSMRSEVAAVTDLEKGVLQTIGYKEFLPYLVRYDSANDREIEKYLRHCAFQLPPATEITIKEGMLSSGEHFKAMTKTEREGSLHHKTIDASITENNDSSSSPVDTAGTSAASLLPAGLTVLRSCLDELKMVTRRYSKKQIKWINNRFLGSKDRQVPDIYELDTSDVGQWNESVCRRAVTIIDAYRNGVSSALEPMERRIHPGTGLNEETSHFCQICQRHFIGEFQWLLHSKSNKHKKRKEGARRKRQLATKQSE